MRRTLWVLLLVLAFQPVLSAQELPEPSAEKSPFGFGAGADWSSRFMWRGLVFSQGSVLQPSVWAGAAGFTFEVWGDFVMSGDTNHHRFDEVDYTLSYERSWGAFSLLTLIRAYTYPNQPGLPSTREFTAKLGYTVRDFTFFTTQNVDVDEYSGAYFGEIGLAYARTLGKRAAFESTLTAGWGSPRFNEAYVGLREGAMNYASLEVSCRFDAGKGVYLKPHAGWSAVLDTSLRERVAAPDNWFAGIAVGWEF
jgi:hypothetical protein